MNRIVTYHNIYAGVNSSSMLHKAIGIFSCSRVFKNVEDAVVYLHSLSDGDVTGIDIALEPYDDGAVRRGRSSR